MLTNISERKAAINITLLIAAFLFSNRDSFRTGFANVTFDVHNIIFFIKAAIMTFSKEQSLYLCNCYHFLQPIKQLLT